MVCSCGVSCWLLPGFCGLVVPLVGLVWCVCGGVICGLVFACLRWFDLGLVGMCGMRFWPLLAIVFFGGLGFRFLYCSVCG